ncbi:hypothetical protein [Mariniblastus fucicola]|uniref:LTXXQ motif protein n=1 Tax=Mariniblastus fucicola TaxID=980251 RepID=A0A5B9P5I2_9BACT|nr:hypothetical protein [Mariniblastus fucicola]QEG20232.1 hypothetical protein MFFC18_00790 [Mariniblastus fucicola]
MIRKAIHSLVISGLCLGGVLSSPALAQDDEPAVGEEVMEIQMSVDNSGGAPVVISSSRMSFAGDLEGGESSFQIFTGDSIAGDWLPNAGAINPLSLLDNTDVREELELVGDQLDQFQSAQNELQEQIREKAQSMAGGKLDPSQMKDIAMEIAELQKGRQAKLESMLLPHQLDRLKQVALQIQMQKSGAARTLLSDQVMEELGIDEAQKKRIEDRQKELKKELAERMEKLKEEIKGKLLSELTSTQQAKLKELSGDKFDYKPNNINDQIRERINQRMKKRVGG